MPLILAPRGSLKDRTIQARVTADQFAAIERLATAHHSSVAEAVRALIADALRRHAIPAMTIPEKAPGEKGKQL